MASLLNPIIEAANRNKATPDVAEVDNLLPPEGAKPPEQAMSETFLAVQQGLKEQTDKAMVLVNELEKTSKKSATAEKTSETAIPEMAKTSISIKKQQDNAQLKLENEQIDIVESAGGTDLQKNLLSELNSDSELVSNLNDKLVDISDDKHTGIQIIDTVINEFRGVQTQAILKAAEKKEAATARQLANIGAATESAVRINQFTKRTVNEATIEDNAQLIRNQADKDLANAKIRSAASSAKRFQEGYVASSVELKNNIQALELEDSIETRNLSKQRIELQKKQLVQSEKRLNFELAQAEKKAEKAALDLEFARKTNPTKVAQAEANLATTQQAVRDKEVLKDVRAKQVNRGQEIFGIAVSDATNIEAAIKGGTPLQKRQLALLQEIGASTETNPVLGASPYEAASNIKIISPSGNVRSTKGTKLLQEITTIQEAKYAKLPKGAPKDLATLKAGFNETAANYEATLAANIASGDSSNPYSAPPMETLVTYNSVARSPLYTKVLKHLNLVEADPEVIFKAAADGFASGVVSQEEIVQGIDSIYSAAAHYNSTADGGFKRVGLSNQTSYNTRITVPATTFQALEDVASIALGPHPAVKALTGKDSFSENLANATAIGKDRTMAVNLTDSSSIQLALARMLSGVKPLPADKNELIE